MFFFGCPSPYILISSIILLEMSPTTRESAIIELMSVGFTRYEASLYITIVSSGPSSYDTLVEESEVPYGRFYVIADKLVNKGLVEILPGRPKVYQAISPNIAIGNYLTGAKERILRALDIEQMVSTI